MRTAKLDWQQQKNIGKGEMSDAGVCAHRLLVLRRFELLVSNREVYQRPVVFRGDRSRTLPRLDRLCTRAATLHKDRQWSTRCTLTTQLAPIHLAHTPGGRWEPQRVHSVGGRGEMRPELR